MKKYLERLYNGIVKENPTLILLLGMCPTLAVSTRAMNGIGMGLSTTAVLILSNLVISLLRKVIPDQVRLPAYIVIVASLVTVTDCQRKYLVCHRRQAGLPPPGGPGHRQHVARYFCRRRRHGPLRTERDPGPGVKRKSRSRLNPF